MVASNSLHPFSVVLPPCPVLLPSSQPHVLKPVVQLVVVSMVNLKAVWRRKAQFVQIDRLAAAGCHGVAAGYFCPIFRAKNVRVLGANQCDSASCRGGPHMISAIARIRYTAASFPPHNLTCTLPCQSTNIQARSIAVYERLTRKGEELSHFSYLT